MPSFSFAPPPNKKKKKQPAQVQEQAPPGGFSFGANGRPPEPNVAPQMGGMGAMLAPFMQQQQQQPPMDLMGILAQLQANKLDSVEEGNRRSQLPSYHPQSMSPWNTGYFGQSLAEQIGPEAVAKSQGATAVNQWNQGFQPQDFPVMGNAHKGVTTGAPTPWQTGFGVPSGPIMGPGGVEPIGRYLSTPYGFGSAMFPPNQNPNLPRMPRY